MDLPRKLRKRLNRRSQRPNNVSAITSVGDNKMSDLQRYIKKRMIRDAEYAEDFEDGYANFKLGVLLRQAREAAGLTQEDIAQQMGTPKATISKIENHAEHVRLSLLRRYAEALGKDLYVSLT
jgi:DNA-binding XRE family transcriptional regulator